MKIFAAVVLLLTMLLLCTGQATATTVSYTISGLGSELIYSESTSFVSEPSMEFMIINDSGSDWTDFHLELEGIGFGGSDYLFMRFVDLGADGIIYSGPGTASFSDENADGYGYNEVLTIDGLSIADGDMLSFTVDIFGGVFPEGLYGYNIYATPSVEGGNTTSVPEPSTMFLLGAGMVGLTGIVRKKMRK